MNFKGNVCKQENIIYLLGIRKDISRNIIYFNVHNVKVYVKSTWH